MRDVCIIGVGNLGGALAIAISKAGFRVTQLVVRNDKIARKVKRTFLRETRISRIESLDRITASLIFISVDDPEIEKAAASIAPWVGTDQIIFHTSGSLPSSALSQLKSSGATIGSMHPLVSISDPFCVAEQFRGKHFCIEGDAEAVKVGNKIARSLGGKPFTVETESKALYHAAAVTAAGHMTALFESAVKMMELSGLGSARAKTILLPLAQSAISNLERDAPEKALTGTFSRLDIQAFQRHIASFSDVPGDLVRLYLELGERSLDLVARRDGESKTLEEFREAVSVAKRKYRC